ncbi:peroxide stress protein YaaA [Inhella crocodyli]|uniref:UPF0246 protein EOD73_01410 n=1 Tax=Inhella crocodyli TaxID=2499851 RepID=A0A3S2UGX0_9BURK|nr:peroxide stress protein YaaA [Inhella crocodyli]RVT87714.1 peroxide stress protein YaaA [Inhella crocodyli]
MLLLLSPAKTLDYESPIPPAWSSQSLGRPALVEQSQPLIERLRALSVSQVAELMELSPALAQLNVDRYQAWRPRHTEANSRAALLAFNGDVYEGLDAASFTTDDIAQAQARLLILSGLYGLLRPLDRLQPYRLEMGRPLATDRGPNLYAYWGDQLAHAIQKRAAQQTVPVVVNLASQEYFKAARRPALKAPVVDCVFEDDQGKGPKVISFFAKRARGLMARWVLRERIDHPDALRAFSGEGYAWQREASSPSRFVFRRTHPH